MPRIHSLADPPLQEIPLVGPVVPMRWMSNLFRLAFLEEADRKSVADGRDPRHQAEIRRLRRLSMAPAAGRHYPVTEGSEADDFLTTEEARQLVELWRSRQPIPEYSDAESDDDDESPSPLAPFSSTLAYDDEYLDDEHPDEFDDDDDWDETEVEADDLDEVDADPDAFAGYEWSADEFDEESELAPSWAAQFATFAAIMLLAALLGSVAGWLIDAWFLSPQQQTTQVEVHGTTTIAPSIVPCAITEPLRPPPRPNTNPDP